MKSTLRDVAQAAGVAESTASRALAGHPAIAEQTRSRIESIAQRLGYKRVRKPHPPVPEARALVGVVVAALSNSFYPYLIDRIHDELDALGYDMILIIDELSDSGSGRKFESLIDNSLSGIIFTTASIDSPGVERLIQHGTPVVLAIRSDRRGLVDVVESDNHMAGAEATRHLLELGHQQIGFILGPRDTSTSLDRYAGCTTALVSVGLNPNPQQTLWGNYSHEGGYSGLVQLMKLTKPPTAVFCANDVIAIGALDACQKLGLRVPEDVSIIGVDDIPMASWSMISLTTVRQPIGDIGALAARHLVARIEGRGENTTRHDILPTSVLQRRTTGKPRV